MTEVKVEIKKYQPIVYDYYNFLKQNCYGKENGMSRQDLAAHFGVNLKRQKSILTEINTSSVFPKLISTCGSIYMCKTKKECEMAYYNEIKSGLARLLKGKKMAQKVSKNGQLKIKLTKDYKDLVECFE